MKRIGETLGPFDLTMVEVGAYHRAWPDWHSGPEQAVLAHEWLRGDVFMPIHWGLFNLALHSWTEPAERVMAAVKKRDVKAFIPRPGQSVEPAAAPALTQWWPERPWETAEESPIVSTAVNGTPARPSSD
jgi:L-ascorbate metabolism protein UlaG (beta-lactamase superfamily)